MRSRRKKKETESALHALPIDTAVDIVLFCFAWLYRLWPKDNSKEEKRSLQTKNPKRNRAHALLMKAGCGFCVRVLWPIPLPMMICKKTYTEILLLTDQWLSAAFWLHISIPYWHRCKRTERMSLHFYVGILGNVLHKITLNTYRATVQYSLCVCV